MQKPRFTLVPLFIAISSFTYAQDYAQQTRTEPQYAVEEVTIIGVRENRTSKGATGLVLDLKETPQSISIVSREFMDDFAAHSINDALKLAPGIQVEQWETNRTNYMSRGFEIKNTQVDGVGMPNSWGIVTGEMDSFGYEKLEVIRGANGLLTGVGNASGTINYIRKRPTNDTQGSLGISAGSADLTRLEVDYSTPFTDSSEWAGRVVVAAEDKGSHLRDYENDRVFLYGVVDGQLTENSTLAFGFSHQENNSTGNLWGALVLNYSDGTQAEFPRSSSTSQNWTMWDTTDDVGFIEYTYNLSDSWNTKLTYNYRSSENESKLFYAYTSDGIDKETGLGLIGWPGNWPDEEEAHLIDWSINGEFDWFNRSHQLILGYSRGDSDYYSSQRPSSLAEPAFGPLPAFPYDGDQIPEPVWGEKVLRSTNFQILERIYGSLKLELTDKFNSIVGFNFAEYHRDGRSKISYAAVDGKNEVTYFDQTEHEFSPYIGLTYDVTDNLLAYVSYSDIYQPQDQKDIAHEYLAPAKGVNYEAGIKMDLMNNILASLALFKAEQKYLATYAGESEGTSYYEGVNVYSQGAELEVVGQVTDVDQFIFAITSLQLEGEDNNSIYKWIPRNTVNLSYSRQLQTYPAIQLGINAKHQSDISNDDSGIKQSAYSTINVFASWNLTDAIDLQFNIDNVTNEKYITSLYNIGFYSAPTQYRASLNWRF